MSRERLLEVKVSKLLLLSSSSEEEEAEAPVVSIRATTAIEIENSSLSMGHGLDRSDPSTHVVKWEILTLP